MRISNEEVGDVSFPYSLKKKYTYGEQCRLFKHLLGKLHLRTCHKRDHYFTFILT